MGSSTYTKLWMQLTIHPENLVKSLSHILNTWFIYLFLHFLIPASPYLFLSTFPPICPSIFTFLSSALIYLFFNVPDTGCENVTQGLIFYQSTLSTTLKDKFTSKGFVYSTSICVFFLFFFFFLPENFYLVIPLPGVLPYPSTPIHAMCNWFQKLRPGALLKRNNHEDK